MDCEHKRIKSVNCVLYCDICGAILPLEFLTGKSSPETEKPVEGQKTTRKRARKGEQN